MGVIVYFDTGFNRGQRAESIWSAEALYRGQACVTVAIQVALLGRLGAASRFW
jgi:hypothetical protein